MWLSLYFFSLFFLFSLSLSPSLKKRKIIGPSGHSMNLMASKSAAKTLMQDASVPVVPGYHGEGQVRESKEKEKREKRERKERERKKKEKERKRKKKERDNKKRRKEKRK